MRRRLLALTLTVLAAGVYANTLRNGFAFDDVHVIVTNENARGVAAAVDALDQPYWPNAPARMGLYRPVTVLGFGLQRELWGDDAAAYHAVSAGLHVAATLLVFALLGSLRASAGASFAGAAVFAVHPVHVEAVANVVGQAELLAAVFFLAACLLYLRRELPAWLRLPGLAMAYVLALGAKEIAITLPAALVLLELTRGVQDGRPAAEADRPAKRLAAQAPAFAAVAAAGIAYLLLRAAALGTATGADVASTLVGTGTLARVAAAVGVWPEYARLLLFPQDLVADYSPGVLQPAGWLDPSVALGLVLAVAVTGLALLARRRAPLAALGVAWFAVVVLPISNLLFPIGILLAERTLYLPSVGLALVVAGTAPVLARRPVRLRRAATVALAAALLLGAWRTWQRNPVWASTDAVMASLAREHPESYRVGWVVADRALLAGRTEEAFSAYAAAVDLAPGHYNLLTTYGSELVIHGRAAEAEPLLRRATGLVPEHPEAWVYLSQSLLNQKRPADALLAALDGLAHVERGRAGLEDQLAFAYADLRKWDAALALRSRSLQYAAVAADWSRWRHLAEIQWHRGDTAASAEALQAARERAPPSARASLGPASFAASGAR